MFLLASLLTSLLCPGPYGQNETEQKAEFVRARILVRLEDAEAAGLEQYFRDLRRTVPRYRRFHPRIQNLQRLPLGAARREGFDLCLGLYESEILDLETRLLEVEGKPWTVQGGECYGLLRGDKVLPLDGSVPERIYLPDPVSVRRFTAALATWRRAFGSASFEEFVKARAPELLPESSFIRMTLRRNPAETGFLRLFADQIQESQKQILLRLCAGISKESTAASAKRKLLLDLFRRIHQPEILARIFLRQGYLSPSRTQELDRYPLVGLVEVDEALDHLSRGPLPQIMNPRGKEAEILTSVLLLLFGGGILILFFRSYRRS